MYKEVLNSTAHRNYPLPDKPWIMTQKWNDLLFMHFPVSQNILAAQLPKGIELDTFEGNAWISITPFRVTNMHFRNMPPLPLIHSFIEINVRTYVKKNGVPGVFFLCMDVNNLPAVLGARIAALPYFYAKMNMKKKKDTIHIESIRKNTSDIALKGSYRPASAAYFPDRSSLTYWLMERYFLWSSRGDTLFRGDIHHMQWKVQDAEVIIEKQNLLPDLPDHSILGNPIFHLADTKRVLVWPIKKVK